MACSIITSIKSKKTAYDVIEAYVNLTALKVSICLQT